MARTLKQLAQFLQLDVDSVTIALEKLGLSEDLTPNQEQQLKQLRDRSIQENKNFLTLVDEVTSAFTDSSVLNLDQFTQLWLEDTYGTSNPHQQSLLGLEQDVIRATAPVAERVAKSAYGFVAAAATQILSGNVEVSEKNGLFSVQELTEAIAMPSLTKKSPLGLKRLSPKNSETKLLGSASAKKEDS